MKKNYVLVLVLVLLLVSVFPATVFAGKPADIHVDVRNSTGGVVYLDLVDANGNHIYKTLEAGISRFDLTDGKYSYYASTACGNQSGILNLNITKVLYILCGTDAPRLELAKSCEWYFNWGDNTYTRWTGWWNNHAHEFGNNWDNMTDWMHGNGYSWECRTTILPEDIAHDSGNPIY